MGQHASFEKTRKLSKKCKKTMDNRKSCFLLFFFLDGKKIPVDPGFQPKTQKWNPESKYAPSSAMFHEKQCFTDFWTPFWRKPRAQLKCIILPGLTNFTSLTWISRHTMTDIRPNAPSIVQTRDKTAFLFTSRSNKSLRTATLVRPDTFSAIPARRPAYGWKACRSLISFQTFTNVRSHACTAIVTTSAAKRCFATNALETFRTPKKMEEYS